MAMLQSERMIECQVTKSPRQMNSTSHGRYMVLWQRQERKAGKLRSRHLRPRNATATPAQHPLSPRYTAMKMRQRRVRRNVPILLGE